MLDMLPDSCATLAPSRYSDIFRQPSRLPTGLVQHTKTCICNYTACTHAIECYWIGLLMFVCELPCERCAAANLGRLRQVLPCRCGAKLKSLGSFHAQAASRRSIAGFGGTPVLPLPQIISDILAVGSNLKAGSEDLTDFDRRRRNELGTRPAEPGEKTSLLALQLHP